MARSTRGRVREPVRPKPVQKVELSEKHTKLRLALVILLVLVGATGIAAGVSSLFGKDPGWSEIKVSMNELHCGEDFTFFYHLGSGGLSASAENRAVTSLYSSAARKAYQLFTKDEVFEDLPNVTYLNAHPNEDVQVDKALYKAFSQIVESGDRSLYLAPVYVRYDDIFACTDDSQTVDFDPYRNPEVKEEYAQAAAFAKDADSVDLELLGDDRVRLKVSKEYADWAKENGVKEYIDFFWMKNAFITDFLADTLAENGYTRGSITSYDGFARNLDSGGEAYSFALSDRMGETIIPAAALDYTGPKSFVYLRNYPAAQRDQWRYYQYENGEIRTSYLDPEDGLCKSALNDLVCYSEKESCAQIMLRMIPLYIADSFQEEKLAALERDGIFALFCRNGKVLYNEPEAVLRNFYENGSLRYEAEQFGK